jgi:hypothetical protein
VRRAILATRALEDTSTNGYPRGARLWIDYIFSSTAAGYQCHLTDAIRDTVQRLIEQNTEMESSKDKYIRTLSEAVVRCHSPERVKSMLRSTIYLLKNGPNPDADFKLVDWPLYSSNYWRNLEVTNLTAAVHLGLTTVIQSYLASEPYSKWDHVTYFGRLVDAVFHSKNEDYLVMLCNNFKEFYGLLGMESSRLIKILEVAAMMDSLEAIRVIMHSKIGDDVSCYKGWGNVVRLAAERGHARIVRFIYEELHKRNMLKEAIYGIAPSVRVSKEETQAGAFWSRVMVCAILGDHMEMVKDALDNGADPDFPTKHAGHLRPLDQYGDQQSKLAASLRRAEVASLLLEYGASRKDIFTQYSLQWPVKRKKH